MILVIMLNKARFGAGKINVRNDLLYFPYPLFPVSKVNIPRCLCSIWTFTKINNVFESYMKRYKTYLK